jgi:hypothetical protein
MYGWGTTEWGILNRKIPEWESPSGEFKHREFPVSHDITWGYSSVITSSRSQTATDTRLTNKTPDPEDSDVNGDVYIGHR